MPQKGEGIAGNFSRRSVSYQIKAAKTVKPRDEQWEAETTAPECAGGFADDGR
jgi:hypothetical protein